MNLTQVKRSELPCTYTRTGKPTLFINGLKGYFTFNTFFQRSFGIKDGDHIMILKDIESNPSEYFIVTPPRAQPDEDSFKLKVSGNVLKLSNKALAKEMILSVLQRKDPHAKVEDLDTRIKVRFAIATNPVVVDNREVFHTYAIMGGTISV